MKKNRLFLAIAVVSLLATVSCSKEDNTYERTIEISKSDSSLLLVKVVPTGNYYSNDAYEKVVKEQIEIGERTASAIDIKNDTLNVYTAQWLTQPTDSFNIGYWTNNGKLRIALSPIYDSNTSYAQVMTLYTCKLQFVGDLSKTYTLE